MKTLAVGVLALLAGCAKVPDPTPEPAQQPPADAKAKPPAPAKEVPAALAAIFKERNTLHKRQTGALLTISAKWEKTERTEAAVVVDWTIDYSGPRRPFTILTPGRNFGDGQTTVHIWYLQPDGNAATFTYAMGGVPWPQYPKKKEWFSVAANGQSTGTIAHGRSYMKGHFGRLPNPGDPPLWAQLEHVANDRGDATGKELGYDEDQWTLDAWTGKLWSPVVEVAVK